MALTEFTVPAVATLPAGANLTALLEHNVTAAPDRVQLRRRVAGRWRDVTNAQFRAEVLALARGFVAAGVQAGDRVAIMSRTRYEWTLADVALWYAAAVPVPIYETSSQEQVEWILSDSGAVGCLVEDAAQAAMVEAVRAGAPALGGVWVIDEGAIPALVDTGRDVPDTALDERRARVSGADLASIVYTSGTTGRPKGCELTHGNLFAEAANICDSMSEVFTPQGSTLLFLPLAHVFARVIEVGCLRSGVVLGHCSDVKNMAAEVAEFRPTLLLSVPRVFETVYNRAAATAAAGGRGAIFDRAAAVAEEYSRSFDQGRPSAVLRLQHAVMDRLVYRRLRAALGGRIHWAVSAGAPLGERLGHFYRGAGVTILEGYGLTEVAGASNLNRPDALRIGTVGRPIPGVSVRTDADGEILLRGPIVFRGYWGNPGATAEVLDSWGWLRTGDLGEIDDAGYLRITGRKKELIVTAGGKNVAPAVLEDRIRAHPLVSQAMVVGDSRPYVACLVTLDAEAMPTWLAAHGKDPSWSAGEAAADPDVIAAVQVAVDEANLAVSRAEGIRRFRILGEDLSLERGQLTPTLKLRRAVVAEDFADDVAALYS